MRKTTLAIIGTVAALMCTPACKKQTPPGADVWAVVNAREIKRDEVDKIYRTRLDTDRPTPPAEEALSLKLTVLEELINNEILLERARKLALEASDGEVEDKFTEMKSPYTEDEFQRQLKERELTVEDLKTDLRRQLSVQKLLNREVVAKVSITDQEVSDFYNQNKAQFNVLEPQFRVAQIVITPRTDPGLRNRRGDDAATDAEARRKAASMLEKLHAGADFNQLAMDYSEDPATAANGGDLGFIPESALKQTDPGTREALQRMRVGDISNVIAIAGGYRIMKLVAREAAGQRQLDDPKTQQFIRDALRNRKEQLLRAAFLAVARNEAQVVNYLARQVLESAGKLPAAEPPKPESAPAKSGESSPSAQPKQ